MRTVRLFTILDHLRTRRRPVAAETLARELDVSVRTIYRDIALLQEIGAPIRGEGGVGYRIERGFFLPPLHFDPDELDALVLGMRLAAVQGDQPLAAAAKRVAAKVHAVLPEDERRGFFDPSLQAFSEKREAADWALRFLSPLRVAVRERDRVQLEYRALSGEWSQRTVCPLGLTVFDKVWVLTAWCDSRDALRSFRVDRVESVRRTGERFPVTLERELAEYLRTL